MPVLRQKNRPLVVAHRGASGYAPENTMSSFDLAIKMKSDMIELDVHPTLDGKLVVIHDDTVDRTTNGHGSVSKMSWNDLKNLNAAARFPDAEQESIPLFSDVLSRYADQIPLMVEVKHGSSIYPGVEKLVVKEIIEQNAADKVELISFDMQALLNLRKISNSFDLGYIFIGNMAWYADICKGVVKALHGAWEFLSRSQVRHAEHEGFATFAWTVNSETEIRRCISLGVNGIVGNYPDRIRSMLEQKRSLMIGK
ncbi:MAG: glycerophosphodiester phosphodiesterase family protein [Nitrososphaerota archaeon]